MVPSTASYHDVTAGTLWWPLSPLTRWPLCCWRRCCPKRVSPALRQNCVIYANVTLRCNTRHPTPGARVRATTSFPHGFPGFGTSSVSGAAARVIRAVHYLSMAMCTCLFANPLLTNTYCLVDSLPTVAPTSTSTTCAVAFAHGARACVWVCTALANRDHPSGHPWNS